MTLTNERKAAITASLGKDYDSKKSTYQSRNKYAISLGVNAATVSNVLNEKWKDNPRLISDKKWIEIANGVGYRFDYREWQTARTTTYLDLTEKLNFAKEYQETFIFCDNAGIGKTYTCKEFAKLNPHTYIIFGSRAGKKNKFIKELATVVGVQHRGRYDDILEETIKALLELAPYNPLLIFDEAGDLDDATYTKIKQIYNELHGKVGMVMIGAGGLRKKLEKGLGSNRNGYDEILSRFGRRFSRITPTNPTEKLKFYQRQTKLICNANGIYDKKKINHIQYMMQNEDMRRVEKEINKYKRNLLRGGEKDKGI